MQRWVAVLLLEVRPVLCLLNPVERGCHLQRNNLLLTKVCGHKVTLQNLVVGGQHHCQMSQSWTVHGCSSGNSLADCLSEACGCHCSFAGGYADLVTQ